MRKLTTLSISFALLATLALVACGGSDSGDATGATATTAPAAAPAISPGVTAVTVHQQDPGGTGKYQFDPKEFRFSKGEKVEFTISAETKFHTFTVKELGIDVAVDGGETETVSFTFDKPGTYKLICIPHQALGMVGTIIVE